MKVLVTGGSGFLGINLIRFLREKGVEEIRVLDIADFDYPEKTEPWIKFTLGDVRDVPVVEKVTEGCDVVVHCAAALPLYSEEDILRPRLTVVETFLMRRESLVLIV
jgi:nucleoside-diphosphate-sugar epimerase